MDPASFAFALAGGIDLCLKCGNAVVELCRRYDTAPTKIGEALLRLEQLCLRIDLQLEVLRDVWASLPEKLQILQNATLHVLQGKLQTSSAKIASLFDGNDRLAMVYKKLQYVLWAQRSIDQMTADLLDWQHTFDPSWFLIMRMASPVLDRSLRNVDDRYPDVKTPQITVATALRADTSVSNVTQDLLPHPRADIQYLTAEAVLSEDGSRNMALADFIPRLPGMDIGHLERDIKELAGALAKVEPSEMGLLQCAGYSATNNDNSQSKQKPEGFEILLAVPQWLNSVHSLRALLQTSRTLHSLHERVQVAQVLGRSVLFLHASRIVHKNIRPESIAMLHYSEAAGVISRVHNGSLGRPFLTGFTRFRFVDTSILRKGNDDWEQDLYRHPSRQGLHPETDYSMPHDVYSLGVVLLEIGLWSSLVVYEPDQRDLRQVKPFPTQLLRGLYLDGHRPPTPSMIKDCLVSLARHQLPVEMGRIYTEVVVACLTCLDDGNRIFGDSSLRQQSDGDGMDIGAAYIEKVLQKLEQIRL